MADSGALPRGGVIHVLQTALIDSGVSFKAENNTITIVKDGVPTVYPLPEVVTRKMISKLAHRYGVNIEWFYHPDMLVKGSKTRQ